MEWARWFGTFSVSLEHVLDNSQKLPQKVGLPLVESTPSRSMNTDDSILRPIEFTSEEFDGHVRNVSSIRYTPTNKPSDSHQPAGPLHPWLAGLLFFDTHD